MTGNRALAEALPAAVAAGTRSAFEALLAEDVRWDRESGGGGCVGREQAGAFYGRLLTAGVTAHVAGLTETDDGDLVVALTISAPDPGAYPGRVTFRLTPRGGVIARILELDRSPDIELLYFDGCPNHDAFLPRLRRLLAGHQVTAPIRLVRVLDEEDARRHRFPGSPTLRINGVDVDPTAGERDAHGLQCRLYRTPNGTRGTPPDQWIIDALPGNPVHDAAAGAVRSGDLATLRQLLDEHPGLARARLAGRGSRTLLHVATDWPGHFPLAADTITALIAAGADPNGPFDGEHAEAPLHWAASSDDVDAVDALLDGGADIEAPGAVIGGGTPLADATAFAQWRAARRLVERGARTTLFDAAALGLLPRLREHLDHDHPAPEDITGAFWGACHGGRPDTAAALLDAGADVNWIGWDDLTPLDAARRSGAAALAAWLETRGARTARG